MYDRVKGVLEVLSSTCLMLDAYRDPEWNEGVCLG